MNTFFIFIFLCSFVSSSLTLLFPNPKTWWAKMITPELYTAGRISTDQYKYASEVGFRTIISQFNFSTEIINGGEVFPTTDSAKKIVTELTDAKFYVLLTNPEDRGNWARIETLQRLRAVLDVAPRPILFHCGSSYSSTFMTLLHFANITRYNSSAQPRVDIDEIFRWGSAIGYPFADMGNLLQLASDVTGQPIPSNPARPDVSIPTWNNYWYVKPVLQNWYIAGQIHSNHLDRIQTTGWSTLINVRKGVTTPPANEPSQEEVPLLNIRDGTGTYVSEGRQSTDRLLATRLNPAKPNRYISDNSTVNYASRNSRCFGDHMGYNEESERRALDEQISPDYLHLPLGGEYGWSTEMWEAYRGSLLAAHFWGNVLVHSESQFRATVISLLTVSYVNQLNSAWAMSRAAEMGIPITEENHPDVVNLFRNVLDD